ncbi:MAG: hypothetical protein ACHQJ6_08140 [Candidatus Berkiellales bacterium]
MLCVRAPELEKRLNQLAALTGRTKSHFVRVALETYFSKQEVSIPIFVAQRAENVEMKCNSGREASEHFNDA